MDPFVKNNLDRWVDWEKTEGKGWYDTNFSTRFLKLGVMSNILLSGGWSSRDTINQYITYFGFEYQEDFVLVMGYLKPQEETYFNELRKALPPS